MRHVYVHVPFCRRRCSYCDFSIAVRKAVPARQFVDTVEQERQLRRGQGEWNEAPLETLYLGGGTPSLLPIEEVARLLEILDASAATSDRDQVTPGCEVTLEANPDDVTAAAAEAWVRAGVSRVSLGVQSFNPAVLSWMHRTHTARQSVRAIEVLRGAGTPSLSLDLIFGLPQQVPSDLSGDLDRALELEPDHLSVYGLTVEPRTPLQRWMSRGMVTPTAAGRWADEFLLAHRTIVAAGYEHYEVSNYAKSGHRALHNCAYWSGASYAGLGPSAHRFDGTTRSWNVNAWAAYDKVMRDRGDPTAGRETLTPAQRRLERAYLALRTREGLAPEEIEALNPEVLTRASAAGWVERLSAADRRPPAAGESAAAGGGPDSGLRLTAEGWLRLDELVTALTTWAQGG